MGEIEKMISFYHLGFQVCAGLAAFFFILAVFMFFKFKIPEIFAIRTGRAIRRTVRQMEELNAMTGRLRAPESPEGGIRTGVEIIPADAQINKSGATDVLNPSGRLKITAKLGMTGNWKKKKYPIRFQIEKSIMVVNSDEII